MKRGGHLWSIVLGLVLACGSNGANVASQPGASATERVLSVTNVEVGEGVVALQSLCSGQTEVYGNGFDDDCDGSIDEVAGQESEALQVAAVWNASADLDLLVVGPAEASETRSLTSGCEASDADFAVERVAFSIPAAGSYRVQLRHAQSCGEPQDAGAVVASVSVAAFGHKVGTFNRTISPDENVHVLAFTLE